MVDEQKKVIIGLELDASDAQKNLSDFKENLDGVKNTNLDKPFKSIKAEIKEATIEAQRLATQFGTNSTQFKAAATRVAELKNNMDDVNISVKNFNPDNKLRSLVTVASGAIGTLQGVAGAMTLIGVESDTAQQTIAKLQALMALGDALDRLEDMKDGFKTLTGVIQSNTIFQKANNAVTVIAATVTKLFGGAVDATSKSFKFLKGAIAATGIGLLIVLLGEAVTAFNEFIGAADAAAEAQKKFNDYHIKNAKEALDINKKSLDNQEKIALANAKNEKESYEIKQKFLRLKGNAEQAHFEEVKHLGDEGVEAAHESAQRIKDINVEGTINSINEKKRLNAKQAELDKQAADKSKQSRDAARQRLKEQLKQEAEIFKTHQEELKTIADEAAKNIALSKLNDKDKELYEINEAFQKQLAITRKYYDEDLKILNSQYKNKIINKTEFEKQLRDLDATKNKVSLLLEEDTGIKRLEVEKKYNQQIAEFIDGYRTTQYQKNKADLIKNFDEQIALADSKQKELLEKLKTEAVSKLDTQETNRKNTINSETNLINVQTENVVGDKDTPETKIAKLQAIWDAEKIFNEARFQEELAKLGEDEEAKNNLRAKYNQDQTENEREQTESRKQIAQAEKEAKLSLMGDIANAANTLSNIIGQQTVAGKALAVASATIDTYKAAAKALASGPPPMNFIQAGMVTAAGIVNIKKILSTKVPAKGGSSAGSAPTITAPTINSTMLNPAQTAVQDVRVTNNPDQIVQAYISNRDLNTREERAAFLNKVNRF